MSGDDSYAPKSPDLSSFYSAGPTQAAPQLQGDNHRDPEYKSEPQSLSSYSFSSPYVPPTQPHQHQHLLHHQQQQPQPQHLLPPSTQGAPVPNHTSYSSTRHQYPSNHPLPYQSDYGSQPQVFPQQKHHHPPYGQSYEDQGSCSGAPSYAQGYLPTGATAIPSIGPTQTPTDMPPRRAPASPAPAIEPSPVRTKFPTARIKRIMQADEEVGKVAQQTPIAVGKALELFMIQMVTKSADVAKEKGSKRVTAQMLKQVVETDEQWDFLREIVSRVENEKEGAKAKGRADSSSDEEISEPKKRTRGGRRKKSAT